MITLKGIDPRMTANNLTPYEPTHPDEILKEEIAYRGISQRKLAKQTGISYTLLNDLIELYNVIKITGKNNKLRNTHDAIRSPKRMKIGVVLLPL